MASPRADTKREGPERGGFQIRVRPLMWCQTNHTRLRNGWPREHHGSRARVLTASAIGTKKVLSPQVR
jgi:hypothetical protein